MKPGTTLVLSLLLATVLLGAAHAIRDPFERGISGGGDDAGAELSLFPNGPWVRPLTFGRARLAADLAWLEAIQYYGRHRQSDRRYPYAETLFGTLTGLDPSFENAYIFGALILAEDESHFEKGRSLLAAGIRANPASWRLTFEYGFLCYLHGPDLAEAVVYLERAGRLPGAPETVRRLAAYAAAKAGKRDLSIALWQEIYRYTENEAVRKMALEYLERLRQAEDFGNERGLR